MMQRRFLATAFLFAGIGLLAGCDKLPQLASSTPAFKACLLYTSDAADE